MYANALVTHTMRHNLQIVPLQKFAREFKAQTKEAGLIRQRANLAPDAFVSHTHFEASATVTRAVNRFVHSASQLHETNLSARGPRHKMPTHV
eukprot:COSAG02_NODE_4001_length_5930_cov_20.519122_3_plen_93_part_00